MYFIMCNNISRNEEIFVSKEKHSKDLQQSIKSGLIPDLDLNLFVKSGYGALVGFCPPNCDTIEQLLNYSMHEYSKLNISQITAVPDTLDIFGYKSDIENGAELVIGPSCSIRGEIWEKAVYCKNYREMLYKESNIQKQKMLKK